MTEHHVFSDMYELADHLDSRAATIREELKDLKPHSGLVQLRNERANTFEEVAHIIRHTQLTLMGEK